MVVNIQVWIKPASEVLNFSSVMGINLLRGEVILGRNHWGVLVALAPCYRDWNRWSQFSEKRKFPVDLASYYYRPWVDTPPCYPPGWVASSPLKVGGTDCCYYPGWSYEFASSFIHQSIRTVLFYFVCQHILLRAGSSPLLLSLPFLPPCHLDFLVEPGN